MDKVVVVPDYFMLIIYIQLGWMGQVDQMLKGSSTKSKWLKSTLYETASKLAVKSGLIRKKPATLYRGIIINTITTDSLSTVKHHEKFSFASFSLNPEVACWFADPKSFMNSEMAVEGTDHLEGYVVEYAPDPTNYLWHPSFADIAVTPVFEGGLDGQKFGYMEYAKMALSRKPDLYSQFVWNVQTQQEVIIKPFGAKLKAHPISEYGCLSSKELNDKYTHPGFKKYLKSNPIDFNFIFGDLYE